MDPERWRKIEALYEAARGVDQERRSKVLEHGCAGDEALRSEVESLLDHAEQVGGFLEVPAVQLFPQFARPAVGERISHYEIQEKIGEGGMGVVYRAEDTLLRRSVALKFLSDRTEADPHFRARFLREAQAAGSLNHPNICTVHGIEEAAGRQFIVMAYVPGETLADRLKRGPLPLATALDITIQLATGLHEAHEGGIVHRDVKSSNVMLTPSGGVVIMDFGLALLAERSRITQAGATLGTISYMSPEQALGKDVDRRTDIWSLGIVLYEAITGHRPFAGRSTEAVCRSILSDKPNPVTAIRRNVPADLAWMIDKALAKNPEERYQHMDDLIVDLRAARRNVPAETEADLNPPPIETAPDAPTISLPDGPAKTAARRANSMEVSAAQRAWNPPLLVFVIALVLATVIFWFRQFL